jgi:hypothetical protein
MGSNSPDNKPERIWITSQLKRPEGTPERGENRRAEATIESSDYLKPQTNGI